MDRARRAGSTALIVVVMVGILGGWGGTGALAAAVGWPPSTLVDLGDPDRWRVGIRRVRGDRQPGQRDGRPGRPGGRLCDVQRFDGDAQGDVDRGDLARPGSPDPHRATPRASTAPSADLTYTGGFAATGGAVALRVVGGAPIDAIGWGDATNGFVEGAPAAAPPAGSSLERSPGGALGNGSDTNDDAADWFVQATPSPQGLAAPPVPVPGPTPVPTRDARLPTPTADADTDADADTGGDAYADRRTDADPARPHRRRRPRRPRRRRRPRRPRPTPDPGARRRPRRPRRRRPLRRCRSPRLAASPTVRRRRSPAC